MTYWPFAVIGGVTIVALVGYLSWPWWQRQLEQRRKPMPPLIRRIPGLPVDGDELTHDEEDQYALIKGLYEYLEAADPMEQS